MVLTFHLETDSIVAEVRQAREALFAEANYDIHEFCRRLSERQETSGHPIVRRSGLAQQKPLEEPPDPSGRHGI